MKKANLMILMSICLILTCCTSNTGIDTYFIHAAAFDKKGNEYTVTALCEKAGEKEVNYFTATASGKSTEDAAKKLQSRYRDCYFATSDVYIIKDNADEKLIYNLAKEICGGNIYSSKSSIICVTDANLYAFMESIENEDDLKQLRKIYEKRKVNAVKFFSEFISGSEIFLPALTLDEKQALKLSEKKEVRYQSRSKT